MSEGGRRRAGWALFVAAVAAATAGFVWKWVAVPGAAELDGAADAARSRNLQALDALARRLESRVRDAARVPELVAALDTQVDEKTLQDILDTEESWSGVRRTFPLTAVVAGRRVLARTGAPAQDLASHALVQETRAKGWASGLHIEEDRLYLLLGAVVSEAKRLAAEQPVLLLGQLGRREAAAAARRGHRRCGGAVQRAPPARVCRSGSAPPRAPVAHRLRVRGPAGAAPVRRKRCGASNGGDGYPGVEGALALGCVHRRRCRRARPRASGPVGPGAGAGSPEHGPVAGAPERRSTRSARGSGAGAVDPSTGNPEGNRGSQPAG